LLKKEGLYSGSVDGKWGPRTRTGVSEFQKRKGIKFDTPEKAVWQAGQLEEQTLKAMFGDDVPEGVTLIENPHHAPRDMWTRECK
jgi:peptidoglycan hydrolase-like protein with peptidoglycan-binding domain